jgi:radical SAM superfamily enzyme with C-terminal helix-hairpin-helix motif
MKIRKAAILDCYVDEPACLGVPPYIAPYPRYIAGVLWKHDVKVHYRTVDQLRKNPDLYSLLNKMDVVIIIAGVTVPGKYLGGTPATLSEIKRIASKIKVFKVLGGPAARFGSGVEGGKRAECVENLKSIFEIIAYGDVEIVVSDLITSGPDKVDAYKTRTSADLKKIAVIGAEVVKQHPDYPNTMAEIETCRGCYRACCSFCIEQFYGKPDYRAIEDIIAEVKALYKAGIRHFRIGRQPDLFAYQSLETEGEFPRPNPKAIEKLYKGIRNTAPELKVLHMDNANPGLISAYPEEARKIAKIIVKYHTSGDVAALGVESADPRVIKANNLKAMPEDSLKAIEIINEVGAKRGESGLPELLPGINFVHGLIGETKETFELNYQFLKEVLNRKLLLRRINIRQVMPFEGTKMGEIGDSIAKKHKALFHYWKKRIREEIDHIMIKQVAPEGTVLRNVRTEIQEGNLTYGRQIGSYPLLVGIPLKLELNKFIDVKVVGHGYRSITALPYPLKANNASLELLSYIPGIGRKRAARVILNRPFQSEVEFLNCFDDPAIGRKALEYIEI